MLELVNVSKRFKKVEAVKQMNMYIEKGEIVGLLGPNGAGKSTTISMMSSLIKPSKGDVLYQGKSILKTPKPLREIIGIVPQELALYGDLTASENLRFFGKIYRLPKKELSKKINLVLEQVGLKDHQKELVRNFSGGMKRRLNIGIALLHYPELIIMDEPTVGIDPHSRKYILETVKRLNEELGMTVVYTSHYMEEVDYLCDRIYIMDRGNLIASGTKEDIKQIISSEQTLHIQVDEVKEDFITQLKNEPQLRQVRQEGEEILALVEKEVNAFKTILKHAEATQVGLRAIHVQSPTLEDVFLHLTGRALRD